VRERQDEETMERDRRKEQMHEARDYKISRSLIHIRVINKISAQTPVWRRLAIQHGNNTQEIVLGKD
jgi:hypothetical protein